MKLRFTEFDEVMDFGERMKKRRDQIGLGQSELARQVGVTRQVIYGWETAGTKPQEIEVTLKVAQALKTSVSYLYGETDHPGPAPEWSSGVGPGNELELRATEARRRLLEVVELLKLDSHLVLTVDAEGRPLHDPPKLRIEAEG